MGIPSGDGAPGASAARPTGSKRAALWPWLTGVVAFGVYLATAAPTIGFGDSPELSAAARSLGVPHPTGYPLLMLLGHGFGVVLAVGDPAWRLNVLTALLSAGAVGLSAAFVQRLTARPVAGWVAGLALAFAPSFWSNATLFEVYGLHLLLLAALLCLWIAYEQDPRPWRLRALVFVAGLALTHHLMIGLVLPVLAVAVLRHGRRFATPLELTRLSLLFVLPLVVLAYLPLASLAEPVVNWGDPSSPLRFWSHVTGRQYHGNVGGETGLPWWSGALEYLGAGLSGPTIPLVGLGLVGAGSALGLRVSAVHRAAGFVLVAIFVVGFGFGSFYAVVDREPFFSNATLAAALLSGLGVAWMLDAFETRRRELARGAVALGALLPLLPLLAHWSAQDRSQDFAAHDRAVAELSILPTNAILLVQGFEGYPAVYASLIEGLRPDVLVVDHYLRMRGDGGGYGPELERLRHTPRHPSRPLPLTVAAVAAALGRPLFMVSGVPDFDWSDVGLVRVRRGLVDQLVATAAAHLPAGRVDDEPLATFEAGPVLLSSQVGRRRVEAGDPLPVSVRWRVPDGMASRGLSVLIVAGDETGTLLQADDGRPLFAQSHPLGQGVPLDASDQQGGWLESVALALPRSLPPGVTSLYLALTRDGAYQPTADGRAFVALGSVELAQRTRHAWGLAPNGDGTGPADDRIRMARSGAGG